METVVLDTCVLVPSLQRDFLLQLAAGGGYMPRWSSGVLDELIDVLTRIDKRNGRRDRSDRHRRLIEQMQLFFPEAVIDAPRDRTYDLNLADLGDEHLLYAALTSNSDTIVSDDRHAGLDESRYVHEAGIRILSGDEFVMHMLCLHGDLAARSVLALHRRRRNPPFSHAMELFRALCPEAAPAETVESMTKMISSARD